MTALLLVLACGRGELPEGEVRCDGLDDDEDGVVDEGLVGHGFEFVLDRAGAPDLDAGFSLELSEFAGLESESLEYLAADGAVTLQLSEFDTSGRLVYLEQWTTSAEGEETGVQISAEYQDELRDGYQVFLTREDFVGQERTSAYELRSEFNEFGLKVESNYLDLLTDARLTYRWGYDAQHRETSAIQTSNGVCREYVTTYDYELNHRFEYALSGCGYLTPGEPAVVTGYDHAGRVLFDVIEQETSSWTWGDTLVESYRTPEGSERLYDYEESRLVGASATGVLSPWTVDWDSENRVTSYRVAPETALSTGIDLTYSEAPGGFVSKVFAEVEGAPFHEREYLFDTFGNLVEALYTDLSTGGTNTGLYEHTCHRSN